MLVCTLSFMLPCTATFLFDVLQQLCRFPNFKTSRTDFGYSYSPIG